MSAMGQVVLGMGFAAEGQLCVGGTPGCSGRKRDEKVMEVPVAGPETQPSSGRACVIPVPCDAGLGAGLLSEAVAPVLVLGGWQMEGDDFWQVEEGLCPDIRGGERIWGWEPVSRASPP